MLRKIKYLFVAAAMLLGTSSCLDKFPGDAIPETEAMQTLSDAEQVLTGIYASMKSSSLHSGLITLLPEIQADQVHAVVANSNTYGSFWQWDFRSTSLELQSVYGTLYALVGSCNFYLDQVQKVQATITDDASLTTLDTYTAEVYTIRALAYSELIKLFCEAYPETDDEAKTTLGVVLSTSYFEPTVAKRASLYDSYQLVVSDLETALSLFQDGDEGPSNIYASQGAAEALMARTALYMRNWDLAIEYSSYLIDGKSDVYALANVNTLYGDPITGEAINEYQYMWSYDVSSEIIWRLGFTTTSFGGRLGTVFFNIERDYANFYPDYVVSDNVYELFSYSDLRGSAVITTQTTGYSSGLLANLVAKYYGNRQFMQSMLYGVSMPKLFRLSEQYLIRAEAYAQKGDYARASNDLTTLRKTRFESGGGAMSVSQDTYIQYISEERQRELFMEGFRLQDLKRWGLGFQREDQTGAQPEASTLKVEAGDPRFVWPIPNHEIEAPGSMVEPNPSNNL